MKKGIAPQLSLSHLIFLMSFIVIACRPPLDYLGKVPGIEQVRPSGLLESGESIEITFSCDMDRGSLDRALHFYCEEKTIGGTLTWPSSARALFTPESLRPPRKYRLVLTTSARSEGGVPLQAPYSRFFSTTEDMVSPELVDISPDPSGSTPLDFPLELRLSFSEPVDRRSFYQAFRFSPELEGSFIWDRGDERVVFSSSTAPSEETTFHLSLSTACTDLASHSLKKPRDWYFTTPAATPPVVEALVFHSSFGRRREEALPQQSYNFDRDETIELIYDGFPEESEGEPRIEIQPSLVFRTEKNEERRSLMIIFEEDALPDRDYRLSSGNTDFFLRCQGPRTETVKIAGVAFCKDTGESFPEFVHIQPNDLISVEESQKACLEIAFFHSAETSLSPVDIMGKLHLNFTNGSAFLTSGSIDLVELPECPDLAAMGPETTIHYHFSVTPQGVPGLMELLVSGDLEDSLGNSLEESILMSFNL